MYLFVLVFVVCGLLSNNVKASTLDQINQDFINILVECLAEYPLSSTDLEAVADKKMPDVEAARCMFACAYKRTGMMDEDGKLSAEGVRKLSSKYFNDDPDKMKISDDFTNACLRVNDEAVKDGTRGCDRAASIFQCSLEKAPEFDFI